MSRYRLKPYAPKLTENDVERACLDYLAVRGYRVHRLHTGRARFLRGGHVVTLEPEGTPDYICVPRGGGFYLETKRPGATASPGQEFMHLRLAVSYGLKTVVVDCVDSLREWLDSFERREVTSK